MASYDVLRDIVRNGSDLTITRRISYSFLRELAQIAHESGAKLTITTHISYELLRELSSLYGKNIAFIDGLEGFEQE